MTHIAMLITTMKANRDRKSTRLNSSHVANSYAVFCLEKKNHIGPNTVDAIVSPNESIDKRIQAIYAEENAQPVIYDMSYLADMRLAIIDRKSTRVNSS